MPLGSHGGSARPVLGTLAGPSLLDLSSWAGAQRRKEGLCPHPGQNAFQGRHQALRCLAVEKGRWAPKPVLPQTDGLGAGTAGPAWLCCCLKILFEGAPRLCPALSPPKQAAGPVRGHVVGGQHPPKVPITLGCAGQPSSTARPLPHPSALSRPVSGLTWKGLPWVTPHLLPGLPASWALTWPGEEGPESPDSDLDRPGEQRRQNKCSIFIRKATKKRTLCHRATSGRTQAEPVPPSLDTATWAGGGHVYKVNTS